MTTPSRFEISSINWRNTDLKLDKESEAEIEDEILTGSSLQTYPTLIAELLQITLPILKVSDTDFLAYIYCKHRDTRGFLCLYLQLISTRLLQFHIRPCGPLIFDLSPLP
jgi:hypothetical protein